MTKDYPAPIYEAAKAVMDIIDKYYPDVKKNNYDDRGFLLGKGCTFEARMRMGIYIELIKAGERPHMEEINEK